MRLEGTVGVCRVCEGERRKHSRQKQQQAKSGDGMGREHPIERIVCEVERSGPIKAGFEPVGRGQIMKSYLVMLAFHETKGKPRKKLEPVRCIILM